MLRNVFFERVKITAPHQHHRTASTSPHCIISTNCVPASFPSSLHPFSPNIKNSTRKSVVLTLGTNHRISPCVCHGCHALLIGLAIFLSDLLLHSQRESFLVVFRLLPTLFFHAPASLRKSASLPGHVQASSDIPF